MIYECTMYYYIQIGCPTKIVFSGDPDNNLLEIVANFEVDEYKIIIKIETIDVPFASFALTRSPEGLDFTSNNLIQTTMRSAGTITFVPFGEGKYRFVILEFSHECIYTFEGYSDYDFFTTEAEATTFERTFNDKNVGEFKLVSGDNMITTKIIITGKILDWRMSNTQCKMWFLPSDSNKQ